MSEQAKFRLGFRTRVLIPMVAIIALLFAVTLWVVNARLTAAMRSQAATNLDAVAAVFENFQDLRGQDLLLRARNIQSDPRFKAVALVNDAKTMSVLLQDLADELNLQVAAFIDEAGTVVAVAGIEEAATNEAVHSLLDEAAHGEFPRDFMLLDNQLIAIAALPVQVGESRSGFVMIGQEIGAKSAADFRMLTGCEEVLHDGGHIIVSTLRGTVSRRVIEQALAASELPSQLEIEGRPYLVRGGGLGPDLSNPRCNYLLLSSMELALAELKSTQWVLVIIGGWGVLATVGIVRFILGRAAAPLEHLQEGAGRIGRGDFSQRLVVNGNDEFAMLARSFNDMTDKLRASRENLEASLATLKETRDRLSQSEKLSAIGEFISGVAHELNNPLTVMIGFTQLLQDADLPPDRKVEVRQIADAAERCHKIVQGLLSFARQRPSERKPVNLNEVLEGTARFLQYECRTSNVEIERDYDPRIAMVLGDSHQLQQVFLNIINNARQAIEASGKKGRIRLRTSSVGGTVRVVIEDDGPGIAPAALARIFDPFFTTKEIGKGTGLGLSVSYGIIQDHDGEIHVESRHGAGATFIIDLPASQLDSVPVARKEPGQASVPAEQPKLKRVLLIDDEPSILLLGQRMLAGSGYTSVAAHNGQAGIEALNQQNFDAVLCDWKMPGPGGRDVFEHIRGSRPDLASRVIIMSGDVLNQGLTDFAAANGVALLAKPFSQGEIREALARLFSPAPSASPNGA